MNSLRLFILSNEKISVISFTSTRHRSGYLTILMGENFSFFFQRAADIMASAVNSAAVARYSDARFTENGTKEFFREHLTFLRTN